MDLNLVHVKELPELNPVKEKGKMIMINTINQAKERVGVRQGLEQLARSISEPKIKSLNLASIETPIAVTAAKLIIRFIEEHWRLSEVFEYCLNYKGETCDEVSQYYYYEVIFSQPTAAYPVPQVTASVYFRVEARKVEKNQCPMMFFRLEGDCSDHDVRFVMPTADWILALIQKKLKFFKRIEAFGLF